MEEMAACEGSVPNVVHSSNGVACIKPEYIVPDHERKLALECITEEDKEKLGSIEDEPEDNGDEAPRKKLRLSKAQKKKLSGQNKARPIAFRLDREKHLCYTLCDVREDAEPPGRCSYDKCTFLHDIKEYLSIKPPDAGPLCYIYSLQGHCPRGLTCRFGSQHLTAEGRNKIDSVLHERYQAEGPKTVNSISKDLQIKLRKWKYDYTKSESVIAEVDAEKKLKQDLLKRAAEEKDNNGITEIVGLSTAGDQSSADVTETPEDEKNKSATVDSDLSESTDVKTSDKEEKRLGPVPDQDLVKTRASEKIVIDWRDKLYLSPLTTVGNLPFRRICKEYGVDITCGEMAMANSIVRGLGQEWALVKRHVSEDIFGVQLCGNNPYVMTKGAQLLEEQADINFIDINLGCPIELVYRRGEGSGMLNRDKILGTVVQCMSRVLTVPLTVKTRTGVQTNKNIAHTLAPKFRDWGVSLITVHGRSREQRYTKSANWAYIEECARAAAPAPVFLNGDILSYQDYERARLECPAVAGAMVGRGALIKPWIFTEIKERRDWDISSTERLAMLRRYVEYGLEHWGTDTKGVENTRRFLLEWLSFLYRYIPVGLLECPPQRVNDRPPYYRGRDELETLMASSNCADWLKISELLLGPLPPNYHFLPKHKANSWK